MEDHFLYKLFINKCTNLVQPMGNQRGHNISKHGKHTELSEYTENCEFSSIHNQTMTYLFRILEKKEPKSPKSPWLKRKEKF